MVGVGRTVDWELGSGLDSGCGEQVVSENSAADGGKELWVELFVTKVVE